MAIYKVPNLTGFEWQKAVLDKDLNTPPSNPNEGDRYLIAGGATGDWTGHDYDLTVYKNGTWEFIVKREGMFVYVKDEDALYYYDGSQWKKFETSSGSTFTWNIVNSNATLEPNNGYLVDCSSSAITLTLPANPSTGDTIKVVDYKENSATNNITLARNGQKIAGLDEDLVIDVNGAGFELVFSDVDQGWVIDSEIQNPDSGSLWESGTGYIQPVNTNTVRIYDNGIVSTSGQSACRVKMSANQTVANETVSIVSFSVVEFDNQNEWDISNYRFVASEDGIYQINVSVLYDIAPSSAKRISVMIYKNGNSYVWFREAISDTINEHQVNGSCLVKLDKNDYIEIKTWHNFGSDATILSVEAYSFVEIVKLV